MEEHLIRYLRGYVRIRISGCARDRFLNLCVCHGILLWQISCCDAHYEACLSVSDFKKIRSIVRKSHVAVRICQRRGLPFFICRYKKRSLCLLGIAAMIAWMIWLSSHLWNITIEGNYGQTDEVLLDYLASDGIHYGMRNAQIDCQQLSADIRNYFSDFTWVSVTLEGTHLAIQVKEGVSTHTESEDTTAEPSSLVISRSGTVKSLTVRSGRPCVQVGDVVEAGTVAVSGLLPVCDDSGALTDMIRVAADADILIETTTSYRDVCRYVQQQKSYTGEERSAWRVRFGSWTIALPAVHRLDAFEQSDRIVQTQQFCIGSSFYLPVYLEKFTVKEYIIQEDEYTKEEIKTIIQSNFQYFAKKLQEKGVQIFENNVKIKWNEKSAIASGSLTTGEEAVRRVPVSSTEEELLKHEYD